MNRKTWHSGISIGIYWKWNISKGISISLSSLCYVSVIVISLKSKRSLKLRRMLKKFYTRRFPFCSRSCPEETMIKLYWSSDWVIFGSHVCFSTNLLWFPNSTLATGATPLNFISFHFPSIFHPFLFNIIHQSIFHHFISHIIMSHFLFTTSWELRCVEWMKRDEELWKRSWVGWSMLSTALRV